MNKPIEMNEITTYSFSLFEKPYSMFVSNADLDYVVKFFNDLNNGVDFHLAKLDFVKSYFVRVSFNMDNPAAVEYYIDVMYKRHPQSFFYEETVNKIFSIWETYTKAKNRQDIIDNLFRD
jgi:hypothetical protein